MDIQTKKEHCFCGQRSFFVVYKIQMINKKSSLLSIMHNVSMSYRHRFAIYS